MKAILTVSLLFFIMCFGKPVEIIKGTKQDWSGGRKGSGYGTNYKLYLVAKAPSSKLEIDQLWVEGYFFEITARKESGQGFVENFEKGDTVFVSARYNKLHYKKENNKKKPEKVSGEVIIGYLLKGKRKYTTFNGLKELEPVRYP